MDLTDAQWAHLEPVSWWTGASTAAALRALGRSQEVEVRRVGWDDKQPVFRRPAKSFENTTTSATGWLQVACITTLRATCHGNEPTGVQSRAQPDHPITANRAERGRSG